MAKDNIKWIVINFAYLLVIGLFTINFACSRPPKPDVQSESINVVVKDKPACTTETIEITQGKLCGVSAKTTNGKSAIAFLSIPYAETTAGENRWRAPIVHKKWDGVFKATEFGPSCPQSANLEYPQSENCLSVNIWTPETKSVEPKAVMVFIYGGAFVFGYNGDPMYNGAYTSAYGDVVVVSMNYRLGALGFLAGIKDKTTGEEINGNFGILDQILALKWVQENISDFGGDPNKITLYGESAGAMSVGIHLVSSPQSKELFRAAIMESNPLGLPYKTLKDARSISKRFARNLGCSIHDILCMRNKLPEVILDAQQQKNMIWPAVFHGIKDLLAWAPVVDGEVVVEQPLKAMSEGELTKPILIGTNRNEGVLFVEKGKAAIKQKTISDVDYKLMVDFIFRDRKIAKKLYEKYPPTGGDNTFVASKVITNYLFTCPSLLTASDSSPNTWSYQFDHVSSFNIWPNTPDCADNVCHGEELPYVFHSAENRGYKFTVNEDQLSNLMVGYWTNFAKELNPSHSENNWPQFEPDALNLIFVTPLSAISAKSDLGANCEFWDSVGYDLRESWWGLF